MNKDYKTVAREASDEFVEKRSRFIGYVKPVKTEEEAVAFINQKRSEHWDARLRIFLARGQYQALQRRRRAIGHGRYACARRNCQK